MAPVAMPSLWLIILQSFKNTVQILNYKKKVGLDYDRSATVGKVEKNSIKFLRPSNGRSNSDTIKNNFSALNGEMVLVFGA
jgi:hypothetical protein